MKTRLRAWFHRRSLAHIGVVAGFLVATLSVVIPAYAAGGVLQLGDSLIKGIFYIIGLVVIWAAGLVGSLCLWIINFILTSQNSVIFSAQLHDVWQSMLNIANIVFFLALIVFSVMIITRTGGYNLKKALTSLITAVVLSNLSYSIVLVMIEAGDALRNLVGTLVGMGGNEMFNALDHLKYLWDPSILGDTQAKVSLFILLVISQLLMAVIMVYVLFRLVFILLERAVRLALLTIIGPIQLSLGVVPMKDIQGLTGNWFGEVVKWVLVMPATFLILAIGQKIAPTDSLQTVSDFLKGYNPENGQNLDQLTGGGAFIFALLSVGIMFAASKTPDMLKLSMSTFTKFFTEGFADKTVLGSIQRGLGNAVKYQTHKFSNWAYQTPALNYKIGNKEFGVNAWRKAAMKVGAKGKGSESLAAKLAYDAKREALGEMHNPRKIKQAQAAQKLLDEDPRYQGYRDNLAKYNSLIAQGLKDDDSRIMELNDLLNNDVQKAKGEIKKAAYKKDPQYEADERIMAEVARETEHKEATMTGRTPDDLFDEWFGNAEKIQKYIETGEPLPAGEKFYKSLYEGGGWFSALRGAAGYPKQLLIAERLKKELDDPEKAKTIMAGMATQPFDDWKSIPGLKNEINRILARRKTSNDLGLIEEIGDGGGAADQPIASTPVGKPATSTEALSKVGSLLAKQQKIKDLAKQQGLSDADLMNASVENVESAIDSLFDSRSPSSQKAKEEIGTHLQLMAQGAGLDNPKAFVDLVLSDSGREAFRRGIQELTAGGIELSDANINKARQLTGSEDFQNSNDQQRLALAREAFGQQVSADALNSLSLATSSSNLQDISEVVEARSNATEGAVIQSMDNALQGFAKIAAQNAYAKSREDLVSARNEAATVNPSEAISAIAASVKPEDTQGVSQAAQQIADSIEEALRTALGNGQSLNISATSLEALGKAVGANFSGQISQLNDKLKLPNDATGSSIGGVAGTSDQASKVYGAMTQLINTLQRQQNKRG